MTTDKEDEPDIERFECSMCHHLYPASQAAAVGTRRLCSGCRSQWFGDDEEDEDE